MSLLLSPTLAGAKGSPYVRADVGAAFPEKFNKVDYDKKAPKKSVVYGVGAGYAFNDQLRADVTISRMHNFTYDHQLFDSIDNIYERFKQDVNSTQFLVNGYYDIVNYCNFTPYVGAGLGIAYNQAKTMKNVTLGAFQKGSHRTDFAWNIGAGVAYKLTQNFAVDLGYKYHNLGKIKSSQTVVLADGSSEIESPFRSKLRAHAVTIGIRYTF